VSVSLYGVKDTFPNGNEGYLWTDARVIWSNGAALNVQNALGFPDDAPGSNTQGLNMYCSAGDRGAWLYHSDQYRGIQYCYTRASGDPGSTVYAEPSSDYMQYVDIGTGGLNVVGYGFRSIEYIVNTCIRVETEVKTLPDRQRLLREIDEAGVMATPRNSAYNELVIEAARESILHGGREARIAHGSAANVRG
jgi:hypothetical protein